MTTKCNPHRVDLNRSNTKRQQDKTTQKKEKDKVVVVFHHATWKLASKSTFPSTHIMQVKQTGKHGKTTQVSQKLSKPTNQATINQSK